MATTSSSSQESAPGVTGTGRQTLRNIIICSLGNLKLHDFGTFKRRLYDFSYGAKPPIPRERLENADWITTTDLLINTYGKEMVLDLMYKVFTLIDLKGPANDLQERRAQHAKLQTPGKRLTAKLQTPGKRVTESAPCVLGTWRQTPRNIIICSLEDLKLRVFVMFKRKLSDFSYGDKPPIPQERLENADWITTTDLLINTYGEEGALDVMYKVFSLIGPIRPAYDLQERRAQSESALGVLGKGRQTPRNIIICSLEDLKQHDFGAFKGKLSDFSYGDKPPIPQERLENADWITTTDILINAYGDEGALDVTYEVFTLMGLMGLANDLQERRALHEIQIKHKQHLLEETKTLVEPSPPGFTLEPQTFPINERYVNLTVASINPVTKFTRKKLIQTAVKQRKSLMDTNAAPEHIDVVKLFSWSHQSRCAVMVSGVPGIGKTTLMKKIVYDWANGELYQRFAFVFFFKFRELNKLGKVSLEEMILQQYPHLEGQIGNILQHAEGPLFIFDGLDESIHQMDFRTTKICSNPKQRENLGVIVDSLVRQRLLMGCSVLVTSHPTRLASINTKNFQRMAEIIGFHHRDQLIYFDHFFGDKELSEKAFHYVQENGTLCTLCYIPSYCWIVCTVLSMCFRAQPTNTDQMMQSWPKTVTQLFVTFVSNILANHRQNKDDTSTTQDLISIGRMAEHGLMNHMTVFDRCHLHSFSVRTDNYLFSCLMMGSGRPPDVDYTFLHLTLQEFLAALVHFINYNPKRLQKSLNRAESYKNGRAEMFFPFLCGLSDSSTRSMLESHVGDMSAEASRHVISWIQRKAKVQKSDKSIRGSRDLLNVFYYPHQSSNTELVLQCIGSNSDIDFSGITLTSADCSVLSFILQSCKETEHLNLKRCKIQDEGLGELLPALHTIRSLSLNYNHLTDSSCPKLALGIRNNRTLRRLDLSGNNLKGPYFSDVMAALSTSQIEELLLYGSRLTDNSCNHLASGIKNNRTLRRLDLSGNNLEGPYFRDLLTALTTSQIEELFLDDNHLTDSSCPHLASGIRNNKTLRRLHLCKNNLEGPHFRDLMTALTTSQIEELYLNYNNLLDSSCNCLVLCIRDNQTLGKLDLSGNNLEGPHFRDLMTALTTSRIEELLLYDNKLTDSSCIHLASGIRNNRTLRKLNLYKNNLKGPHFSDLMTALTTSQIEELLLTYNKLTDRSCTHLALGIRNNQNLRKLDLSENNLKGPHLGDLMTALATSQIEELLLQDVGLTYEYAPFLVSLSNCTTLTVLDLKYNHLTDASAEYIEDLILTSTRLKEIRIDENDFSIDGEEKLRKLMDEIRDYEKSGYGDLKKSDASAESKEESDNLVTPIVDGATYRLELEPGRLFRCLETGIMFKVKSEVTITYELGFEGDYEEQVQENGYDIVGPVFNITVEPGVVSEVHLPHSLCLEGLKRGITLIRFGHFKDGKMKIIKPLTIGPSHIVLENPSFSGLSPLLSKLWRRPVSFKGKVLLYSKVVCPQNKEYSEYRFHLYVIPRNQPEITKLHKQKQNKGFQDMEKPHDMTSRLYTKTDYTVRAHPDGKISRELVQFEISCETESLSFTEVNVDRNAKELSLSISLMGSDDPLWKGDITEGDLKEMQSSACASVLSSVGSSPSGKHFVDEHREKLIQKVSNVKQVVDKLKDLDLLNDELYDIVISKETSQDQMREIFRVARSWGDDGKDNLLDVLKKTNKQLINDINI
ncbi:NACHT, LRR and PYD domains-containing protein 3-like [Rana temporaria]|uniref:NACHT, LRR and PYD domains-containing protein 3-like n=1 Tax=Rana temporaria TaxID=8407 RepID=UPI001AADD9EC|nr:NACHT, LRR and PYD domains-containing protein 3-like [Rana temporaria]